MSEYKLTVGLEIHAELKTATKMFCNSKVDTDEIEPNVNICPVCMGYPGSLPVINKEAVRSVLRLGVAVGGDIADYTEFDRKNYFYPDIPKGYQISQYKYPLVSGGSIAGVDLTRIHLEEDTAKSLHNDESESLLDFNRAGIPLVELVTLPLIHDAETAGRFAREFQLLISLAYLDISNANMEKGEMRVEANISVSKTGDKGTKVEVKNINSFKAMEKAISYEYERQVALLEGGGEVVQETRGWDDVKGETFSQRVKEESHDYRYFPDPDLPKLHLSKVREFSTSELSKTLPELPWQKRERLKKDFDLKEGDIDIYTRDTLWGDYFESVAKALHDKGLIQLASNYITSDLKTPVDTESFVVVMQMIDDGELSSRGAKDILKILQEEGGDPKKIAKEKDLIQKSDEAELKKVVEQVISENQDAVGEYKKGKEASLQYLVGQAMKETKGSANPKILHKLFTEALK